jgi:hypothetical protein
MGLPAQHPSPYNLRLRSTDPIIEVAASNLSVVLDAADAEPGSLFQIKHSSNVIFTVRDVGSPGLAVAATDCNYDPASTSEPFVSFRTFADREHLRIDSNGVWCDAVTTPMFTNLVDDWVTPQVFLPPTANALMNAYIELSNMIVMSGGGGIGSNLAGGYQFGLVNSYLSTSVLDAPTANALRGAYYNLSNLLAVRLNTIASALPGTLQQLALLAASGSNFGPCNVGLVAPSFQLTNDVWLPSTDGEPRLYFASLGATTFAANVNNSDNDVFRWFYNGLQENLMTLDYTGNLGVHGSATISGGLAVSNTAIVCGDLIVKSNASFSSDVRVLGSLNVQTVSHAYSNVTVYTSQEITSNLTVDGSLSVAGDATFGSNDVLVNGRLLLGSDSVFTHAGGNVGINLPPGMDPVATLHVNGAVFSTEEIFALSDSNVKTDVQPLQDALAMLDHIHGCTYVRTDRTGGSRQLGVIAQDVLKAVPEAVHVGSDGMLSVAYGNLVAVVIEGVKELVQLRERDMGVIRDLNARLAALERGAIFTLD